MKAKRDVKNISKNLLKVYANSNKKSMQIFCDLAGVSLRSFQYYISGEKTPKYSTLKKIADFADMEVDDFLY